jgi:shikimate kinase
MNERRIVITGFMGSGKTSVARALGQRLNCSSIDLDEEITALNELTPAELIVQQGEAAFREIETNALHQALEHGARIIALGGGAWTIPRNRDLLAARSCLTVWLDVPFEVCWRRITTAGVNRPLAPNRQQARALFVERRPLYRLATIRIATNEEIQATEVARRIEEAIR